MFKLKNYNFGLFAVAPLVLAFLITNNAQQNFLNQQNKISLREEKAQILDEASSADESADKIWWLNSGGKVYFQGNSIKTIQGDLNEKDYWRLRYGQSNPEETDNGYHPQNIFRLVTKTRYKSPSQSMSFKINRYILSKSASRNASNGILFFAHYVNRDNLYYTGLRVDGFAVIKKKINGVYYTLSYKPVFNQQKYDKKTNPILIPVNKWIGLKSELKIINSKKIEITLYIDKDMSGNWQIVAKAIDDGLNFGGNVIVQSGHAGIRSDFMDAEFKDYKIR